MWLCNSNLCVHPQYVCAVTFQRKQSLKGILDGSRSLHRLTFDCVVHFLTFGLHAHRALYSESDQSHLLTALILA